MILETKLKKSTLALSALTLALAAGLSACGGGSSTYTIGGVVTGLEFDGLVLTNNGEDLTLAAAGYTDIKDDKTGEVIGRRPNDVSYAFKNQVDYGDTYNVTVKTSPPHQICGPSQIPGTSTQDTAGRLSVINAAFNCVLVQNRIGGSVTGLTGTGLVLTNGSNGGTASIAANAENFTFEVPVTYGQTYGVTVLTQPEGQTCTVTNGAGKMGDNPVNNITVACRSNA